MWNTVSSTNNYKVTFKYAGKTLVNFKLNVYIITLVSKYNECYSEIYPELIKNKLPWTLSAGNLFKDPRFRLYGWDIYYRNSQDGNYFITVWTLDSDTQIINIYIDKGNVVLDNIVNKSISSYIWEKSKRYYSQIFPWINNWI